ncbi:MAG TPA: MATE family efflux transporter [Candidatus Limnocylindria bacterium]
MTGEPRAGAPSSRAAQLALLSPDRAAFALAWPGIIEQLIRASGQIVVFGFIGHLGAIAIAAVGAALQFTFLLFPVFNALSIGTIALVSRQMGEGEPGAAADAVRQSLLLGAGLGIATGVLFAIFARPLLGLIGAAPEVADAGAPYLAIVGGLNVFQTISIIGVSAMRAAGDARTPMWLSAVASALVVPGTYLLVTVAGLGIIGAAYAQIAISVAFTIATVTLLWRGRAGLRIAGGNWALRGERLRTLASISGYSAGESLLFSLGILGLGVLVFRLGTTAYAAHQIVSQLETLSFLPCIGFSAAASALVGQSLGMGDPKRAMRSGWAAARMAAVWTTIAGALLAAFPALFIGIFTSDATVIAAGIGALVVVGFAQPAQAVNFAIAGGLRGAGDTRFTLFATIVNWLVIRLPLAYLLAFPIGLGLAGIWLAVLIDYAVRAVILMLRFRGGRWTRLRY